MISFAFLREIEVINEQEKRKENFMYLMVEFPRVVHRDLDYAIVYFEKDGNETTQVSVMFNNHNELKEQILTSCKNMNSFEP